ncbi:hypothetical protein [Kytococcus sp. Marseille-QA3725]
MEETPHPRRAMLAGMAGAVAVTAAACTGSRETDPHQPTGGHLPPELDEKVAALLGDSGSHSSDAWRKAARGLGLLSAADPSFAGGMSPDRSAAENKAALVAATVEAQRTRSEVLIPAGRYEVDAISTRDLDPGPDVERAGHLPVMWRGSGASFAADGARRLTFGDATWRDPELGPRGTVLIAPDTLAPDQPWLDIGDASGAEGSTLRDLALVGPGHGVGVRLGWVSQNPTTPSERASGGGWPVRQRWDNVSIANFDVGYQSTCENSVFVSLLVMACRIGIATGYAFNGNLFLGVNVERCSEIGILLTHSSTNFFLGGVIQSNPASKGQVVLEQSSFNNVLQGIYFETDHHEATAEEPYVAVSIGATNEWGLEGRGDNCTGNKVLDCHWDFHTEHATIRVANSHRTTLENTYSKQHGGAVPPRIDLQAGEGHRVVGHWPQGVTGHGAARAYLEVDGSPTQFPYGLRTQPGEASPATAGPVAPRTGYLRSPATGEVDLTTIDGTADSLRVAADGATKVVLPDPGALTAGHTLHLRVPKGTPLVSRGAGATVEGAPSWATTEPVTTVVVAGKGSWEVW